MAAISLEAVSRTVGSTRVLVDVELDVDDGELLVLLGRSGSGKTSLLRAIAGLDRIDSGRVRLDGVDVTGTPTRDRDVAIVFQERSLFGTHDVRANIGFPLWARKRPAQEIRDRVSAEVRALGIEDLLARRPAELSAGQQRLVEIARAMVRAPRAFLLDEPLADLDAAARTRLRTEIRTLQEGYGVAMVYATNDPADAMVVGDRVAVVDSGRLLQVDPPEAVRALPIDRVTASLTGPIGCLEVTVVADPPGFWVERPGLRLRAWAPELASHAGASVVLGVRPEEVRIDEDGPVVAAVGAVSYRSGSVGRDVVIGDMEMPAQLPVDLEPGTSVRIRLGRWHLFESAGRTICTVG